VQIVRRIQKPARPMIRRGCSSAQYGMPALAVAGRLDHASIAAALDNLAMLKAA
jgi:hypothetical protein